MQKLESKHSICERTSGQNLHCQGAQTEAKYGTKEPHAPGTTKNINRLYTLEKTDVSPSPYCKYLDWIFPEAVTPQLVGRSE